MATTMTIEGTDTREAGQATRFTHTLASEWSKLTAQRSTYVALSLGLVLSIAMAALVGVAVGSTFDDWSPTQQAEFEPVVFSLAGMIVTLIAFSVFGVMAVAGEYSSGMIRLTLTATPARGRVLTAKALLVTLVLLPVGLLALTGMFLTGQAVYAAYDMPSTGLGDPDARRAILGLAIQTPLFPLIGLALGFLLRSTAAAVTAVLALIWLPEILGGLLPIWSRENILSRLPGPSIDSFTIGHLVDSPSYPDPAVGAATAVVWLVLFLSGAWLALMRRDV